MSQTNALKEVTAEAVSTNVQNIRNTLADHFVHDGEMWTENPANPASLEKCIEVTSQVMLLKEGAAKVDDESNWLLGNMICVGRDKWGDLFDLSEIGEVTGRSYNTLVTSESVFLEWGDRRFRDLSFTHHKEVHYVKDITTEQKMLILQKANDLQLSTKQTRALASIVKNESSDILLDDLTELEIINEIDSYKKETEPEYICISFDNEVKQIKESKLTDDNISGYRIVIRIKPELEIFKEVDPAQS
ncbi:MAG: hypothetical protein ACPH5P_00145 [Akkermansiaceae bacterium]